MSEFQGRVALVTGGASGIGAAIAGQLLRAGASVAILDLVVANAPSELFAVEADIANSRSVEQAVAAVVEKFGRIDILINNAGVGAQGTVTENTDEDWARVFDINVVGIARLTRATLPWLKESDSAAIVNIASIAATAGLPRRALYSASKGAVLALTYAMAADYVHDGIRVNCVSPGTADTPWVGRLLAGSGDPEAERNALAARQPHGRLVRPDEIAAAVVYLAGPNSGSTNGVNLAVDGGMQNLRLPSN